MSMPKIPDMNPDITIKREDAVNIIIASIAMEELALAHILNAEGEKLQYVLGTLDEKKPGDVTICDVMAVNKSIQKTLREVINAEMLLQFKLEDAVELSESENECQKTIKGQKIWKDGDNIHKTRPASVVITLLRDGVAYDTVSVNSAGNGNFSFGCVPVSDGSGHEYTYTVDEIVVPTGYKKTVSGFNITNTALPGTTTINGTKTWVGDTVDDRPAEITVNLLRNGVKLESKKVPNNATTFSFSDVPQFDSEGTPFVYTVDEDEVEDYAKSIEGYNITNTPA